MNSPDNMTLQALVDQDGASNQANDGVRWSEKFAWLARILVLIVLVAAPWMIGSVQFWSQFWIASALLIALALWWFETALNKRSVQVIPYFAVFLVLAIVIGLLQILPLSEGLGDLLLGRQIELYQQFTQPTVGEDESLYVTQRISLNAVGTWHHIRLLVLALGALLLSCRYFRTLRDLTLFFITMTVNGVLLALFGIVQKSTWNGELFWTIPLSLGGTPFGPYVNRNNAAGFLLISLACAVGLMHLAMSKRKNRGPIPIISKEIPVWRQFSQQLLYFISELTAAKVASLLAIVVISVGIIGSLSRGAILALFVAAACSIVSYGIAKRPKNLSVIIIPLTLAIIILTGWLGFSDDVMTRFDKADTTQEISKWDIRGQIWMDTLPSVNDMGKFGSGLGSFATVSRLYRTNKEVSVYDYAENQYVQAFVEAGWLGLILYLLAWALAFYYAYFLLQLSQSPSTTSVGIAAVFLLWAQAFASFFDFGFYIPANTVAMASFVGVIAYFAHSLAYRLKQTSILRFQFMNSWVQLVLVVVFAASTVVSLDLNRKSRIESLRSPRILSYDNLDYETANHRIKGLSALALNSQSVVAMNELGRLGIHRARLEMFEDYKSQVHVASSDTEQVNRIWNETSLVRLQESAELAKRSSTLSLNQFRNQEALQVNLPFAKVWFESSLRLAPLQPEVQLTVGEIKAVLQGIEAAQPYLERAVSLAPANAILRQQVSVLYIQAGSMQAAAPHLKRFLELVPQDFSLMLNLVAEQMQYGSEIDHVLILNEMLPDSPELIYRFATEYAEDGSDMQKVALEKAEDLLELLSRSDPKLKVLHGRIRVAMGDYDAGIDYYSQAIVSTPNDQVVRLELVEALIVEERYEEALEQTRELIRSNDKNRLYRKMFDGIKSKMDELNNN